MRNTLIGVAALALASGTMTAAAAEQGRGAYAAVNGIKMYYETYGPASSVPLVLLHGGGSMIDSTFGRIIPFLARDRRVIAIEEQAHGRTSDRDAPVRFAQPQLWEIIRTADFTEMPQGPKDAEHRVELTHLLPNARLLVLAGGHGEYMGEATTTQRARAPERTAAMVEEFLDGVSG